MGSSSIGASSSALLSAIEFSMLFAIAQAESSSMVTVVLNSCVHSSSCTEMRAPHVRMEKRGMETGEENPTGGGAEGMNQQDDHGGGEEDFYDKTLVFPMIQV